MPDTPWFTVDTSDGRTTLRLAGAWRLHCLAEIESALKGLALPAHAAIDASALTEIDSAAALVLLRTLRRGDDPTASPPWVGIGAAHGRIVEQVRAMLTATET
ncbi:MAG: hypothetical protein OEY03_17940, partial [Rhizobacter sp.]|nr:hypothetical protein [Rhizobacter sp.]